MDKETAPSCLSPVFTEIGTLFTNKQICVKKIPYLSSFSPLGDPAGLQIFGNCSGQREVTQLYFINAVHRRQAKKGCILYWVQFYICLAVFKTKVFNVSLFRRQGSLLFF